MKRMKKNIWIILLVFCLPEIVYSQQTVSVRLEDRPIVELINEIEKQAGYKVFCEIEKLDSLMISVSCEGCLPAGLLQEALRKTDLKVTEYKNILFINEVEFVTSLPEGYFDINKKEGGTGYDMSGILLGSRRDQKATSEHKVYEIGDPGEITEGSVILTGNIRDFKTGEPMTGIALFIRDPLIGTTTDAFGYYSIQLPVGRHDLFIQGMGMKDTKRQIQLHAGGKLDIELEEQVYALREVTISSERIANVRGTTMGVERLKIKEIKNIPMAFGEVDILRVVMSLPGVKSVGEASSGFNVRGGATDQNLILYNDGTVYNPTHLFGFFSAFNPDVIKDMELYKSSIPAQYGGRLSSVLDINSREGNKKEFKGSASIGLLTSQVTLEGPVYKDKTSFIASGRTTYSDWILNKLPEKSGYKDGNAGFYDLNASVNHKFDEYNNLYVNGYFSRDRFNFNEYEHYSYQNANASVKWRHIFSPKLTSSYTFGYDHYDYRTRSTENPAEAYTLAFNINQYFGKTDFVWYTSDKHTVDFGASGLFYNLSPGEYLPYNNDSYIVPDHMQKEKAFEGALYLGDQWDLTTDFSIKAGVRYSFFGAVGPRTYNTYDDNYLPSLSTVTGQEVKEGGIFKTYHGPEFRISTRYEIADGLSLKAGYNTMRQYIHKLSNTTVMSPTDTWKLSDATIRPQTGWQAAAGIYKNLASNTIELSMEGYYKKMNNYLDYRSGAELIMNHHIETDVLETEGKAYGVELMVKKLLGKLNGWVSYTYSRTQLRQSDLRVAEPVNNGNWYASDYDKPHEFKLVGNYRFTHRFSLSLNCDYSTGRPITLPVSKYEYAGGEYVFYSDRNQYRIPDFFRMDASFNVEPSHHLTLLTHSTISFGVYNLTGRKNAYSIYYVNEEGALKGYKLAIFGVPIPFVSYNIKF